MSSLLLTAKLHFSSNHSLLALILTLSCFALYLPGIEAPFVTTGEPREALVAQSMVIHDDLLQSVRYDHDLATKPPLLHWLMVASSKITGGMNEAASRLPSVIAATIALLAWTLFLLPHIGISRSLLSFAILATSVEWYRHAAHARVDMLLAACITCSLVFLFYWSQQVKAKFLIFAGAFMALAALTKGPVGIALPILITLTALAFWKKVSLRRIFQLALTSALAALPLLFWYFAEFWITEGNLLDIVLHENLHRILGEMSSGEDPHTHGPIYLLLAFFTGLMPWSFLLLLSVPYFWKHPIAVFQNDSTKRLLQWCIVATIVCFSLFLIPSSKRGVYLLPIYPAASTLLAVLLYEYSWRSTRASGRACTIIGAILMLIWSVTLLIRFNLIDLSSFATSAKRLERLQFYSSFFQLSSSSQLSELAIQALPILAIVAILLFYSQKYPLAYFRIAAMLAFLFVFVKIEFVVPLTQKLSSKSFISSELSDHNPSELSMQSIRMYSQVFYARQFRPHLEIKDRSEDSKYLLLWSDHENELPKPGYVHKSPGYVDKPGRYLEFAITN